MSQELFFRQLSYPTKIWKQDPDHDEDEHDHGCKRYGDCWVVRSALLRVWLNYTHGRVLTEMVISRQLCMLGQKIIPYCGWEKVFSLDIPFYRTRQAASGDA